MKETLYERKMESNEWPVNERVDNVRKGEHQTNRKQQKENKLSTGESGQSTSNMKKRFVVWVDHCRSLWPFSFSHWSLTLAALPPVLSISRGLPMTGMCFKFQLLGSLLSDKQFRIVYFNSSSVTGHCRAEKLPSRPLFRSFSSSPQFPFNSFLSLVTPF